MKTSLRERIKMVFQRSSASKPDNQRVGFSLIEDENNFLIGAQSAFSSPRDRVSYSRQQSMQDSLDAWRYNPLARRIVELTTQYAAGGGLLVKCADKTTQHFLDEFWAHRLNRMDQRINQFSDELCLTGNLFLLLSTDASGMSYLRVIPAGDVLAIESSQNDIEQELAYRLKADQDGDEQVIPAYDALKESCQEGAAFPPPGRRWASGCIPGMRRLFTSRI